MAKNSVVHFEIYADDPDALAKFYTSLFDWKVEPVPGMDYRMVQTTDTAAGGEPAVAGGMDPHDRRDRLLVHLRPAGRLLGRGGGGT